MSSEYEHEEKVLVNILMPTRLKSAGIKEAARRGLSLSGLVKNYLSTFLQENIERSILNINVSNNKEDKKMDTV